MANTNTNTALTVTHVKSRLQISSILYDQLMIKARVMAERQFVVSLRDTCGTISWLGTVG